MNGAGKAQIDGVVGMEGSDEPVPVMGALGSTGESTLDNIFSESDDDVVGDGGAPAAAPAVVAAPPATVQPAVVRPASSDPLSHIPTSLLSKPGDPPAPVLHTPPPTSEQDAADDKKADDIARRFNTAEERRAFYEVRNELKAQRTKAREFERVAAEHAQKLAKIEADRTKTPEPAKPVVEDLAKIEAMEKKIKDYEDKLGKLDLTQSETFRQQYEVPASLMQNKLVKMLTRADRPVDQARQLAQEILSHNDRDSQLALVAEDPVPVQGAILNILTDLEELRENRNVAVENWKTSRAAVEEEQRRNAQQNFIKNVHVATDEVVADLQSQGNFLLAPVLDNPEWNTGVERRINAAKGVLQSADPKTIAKYVVDGVTAGDLRMHYFNLVQAYKALQAEAGALVSRSPSISGSTPPGAPVAPGARPKTSEDVLDGLFGTGRELE